MLPGVVKERAVAEAEKRPASASRRCHPETTHRVKRVNISRRALRGCCLKESRETTKEEYTRAGLYSCADTLSCLTLQTTTERPEFSLGLSEFGARARVHPASPLLPPNRPPRLCERDLRAYGGVSRAADRVSESTSD